MRTPKETFLQSGKAGEFQKIAANDAFEIACDYAILQLLSEMPPNTTPSLPTDPYVGIDANAQMTGARRVIAILRSLYDPIKPTETAKRPSLNYTIPK